MGLGAGAKSIFTIMEVIEVLVSLGSTIHMGNILFIEFVSHRYHRVVI